MFVRGDTLPPAPFRSRGDIRGAQTLRDAGTGKMSRRAIRRVRIRVDVGRGVLVSLLHWLVGALESAPCSALISIHNSLYEHLSVFDRRLQNCKLSLLRLLGYR